MMNTANQSFDKTLKLIQFYTDLLMYHQTKFGRKRLSCSEDIIWTKPGQADTRYYLGKTWTGRHKILSGQNLDRQTHNDSSYISTSPPPPPLNFAVGAGEGGIKFFLFKAQDKQNHTPQREILKKKKGSPAVSLYLLCRK